MQWKSWATLTSVFLLTAALELVSQDRQIRTRVDLVVVPVSVRDNNGSLVTGLDQEDFTVLEDGKPQALDPWQRSARPWRHPDRRQ